MRAAVVYYSMSGNCEQTAEKIGFRLGADVIRISPDKIYPSTGVKKFLWGGKSALMGEAPKLQPYQFDAEAYDLVIIGFPIWAGTFAPPIRTFLQENAQALKTKKLALFACSSGISPDKAFGKVKEALGTDSFAATLHLLDPKVKPGKDKDTKIMEFCDGLASL